MKVTRFLKFIQLKPFYFAGLVNPYKTVEYIDLSSCKIKPFITTPFDWSSLFVIPFSILNKNCNYSFLDLIRPAQIGTQHLPCFWLIWD